MYQQLAEQFTIEFLDELGAGGLGRVNRVRVTSSNAASMPVGSEWAAKRLNSRWQSDPTAQARFDREIKALSAMSHGNVVSCVGVNLPQGERFYLMPLYQRSVRRHIAAGGNRNDWRSIANYGAILADALHYAQSSGFIHRDVKPDNILFNPKGPLVVADWGIGYFIHKQSTVLQQLTRGGMGTAYYCSAEQWLSGKCDERGDIYSLGMTLDEWLTGSQRAILVGAGLGNSAAVDWTTGARELNAILKKMTQPRAIDRPASMVDVARALRSVAAYA